MLLVLRQVLIDRRGVPHINIPTTLMGYVDAAVGVKVGINFNGCKNRVGAFAPPQQTLLDRSFFVTLPLRHIQNGVGEILKLAVIKDSKLLNMLENDGFECISNKFQDRVGKLILERAIQGLLEELQPNLFEGNLSRAADFGHTFSVFLEMEPHLDILHGEAVATDIVYSCVLAHHRGLLSTLELNRILDLVVTLGLNIFHSPMTPDLLWKSIEERTTHRNGNQRLPLPCAIGEHVFVNDVQYQELEAVCDFFAERVKVQTC